MAISLKALGLPKDIVTVFRIDEAPAVLQECDMSNEGKSIYVIPDKLAQHFKVLNSIHFSLIKGATVFVV